MWPPWYSSLRYRSIQSSLAALTRTPSFPPLRWTIQPLTERLYQFPSSLLAAVLAVAVRVFVVNCPIPVALLGIFVVPLVVVLPPLLAALVFGLVAKGDEAVLN